MYGSTIFLTSTIEGDSGFGGLEVSVLALRTRVRGFKSGRIFRKKKSLAPLLSEGK